MLNVHGTRTCLLVDVLLLLRPPLSSSPFSPLLVLVDLPAYIESFKTHQNSVICKSSDIHQMLWVFDEQEAEDARQGIFSTSSNLCTLMSSRGLFSLCLPAPAASFALPCLCVYLARSVSVSVSLLVISQPLFMCVSSSASASSSSISASSALRFCRIAWRKKQQTVEEAIRRGRNKKPFVWDGRLRPIDCSMEYRMYACALWPRDTSFSCGVVEVCLSHSFPCYPSHSLELS
jgi:TAFII55 protein conserved region